jgi:Domain of unknown function (DUF4384)/PEGA domain
MNVKNFTAATVTLFAGVFGLGSAFAQSQPIVRPQAVIVNPAPTELKVSVALNKAGANPLYLEGENLKISVNVNQDAYVYVFNIQSTGAITVLLPNGFPGGQQPFLRAGETRTFPGSGDKYQLNIQAPFGQEKIFALASKNPLNLSGIIPQVQTGNFVNATVQGSEGLARPLAVVVTPLPPTDWTTAFVDFTTARPVSNGTLAITSNAPNSSVLVDGTLIGNAPVSVAAVPGSHTIRISAPGYGDYNQTVNVNAGQTTAVNARLNALQQNGTLQILAPNGSSVFVDNRLVANGSITGVATAGNHAIRVTLDGYSDFNQTVNVNVGQTTVVDARNLQAIVTNGTLRINSQSGAEVYVNGQFQGNLTGSSAELPLAAGQYAITVRLAGYRDFQQNVVVSGGRVTVVNANLQAVATNGNLSIVNSVRGASVFINGQLVGKIGNNGSLLVKNLPAGTHELVVVAAGYRGFVQAFTINGGQTTTVVASLLRL